jgi:mRNA-degrading endonuclease RelE of RelBE toxin-antitoxin system
VYQLEITPEGARSLDRLPEKVRPAVSAAISGPLAENPTRLGKPLVGQLAGLRVARRGDYRIIYEIHEERNLVIVHRVQHRRDIYRTR